MPNSRSSAFRPDIEGLRGIAVFLVVAFHCDLPVFSSGFVGVDVFFVLSGYLITGLLVAETQKTSRLDLLKFYARRVRRLLPASALVLLVTMLLGAAILSPQELVFASGAARATALYVSNVYFARNAADYFAPEVKTNPMLHTWSLGVEEQFYLFWPLLIMIGLLYWKSRRALFTVLFALTVFSLALCVWMTARSPVSAFYGLPGRAWEFGAGGLFVLLPRGTLKRLPARVWLAIGWLGVLAILASGSLISGDAGFPGWVALAPVLGTVAALVVGRDEPRRGAGLVLESAPLQLLGRLSYSWYLWHWPFLVFATALVPNISVAGKSLAASAALAVAAITHHLIENPIRFHPYLVKRPKLTLSLAAVLTVLSVGTAMVFRSLGVRLATGSASKPEMKAITEAVEDFSRLPTRECFPSFESDDVRMCVYGDVNSPTNIVLFGDSHAEHWFNPLQRIADSRGWKLSTMVKGACAAVDVRNPRLEPGFEPHCSVWRAEAMRQIIALRPSLVLIGNATAKLGSKGRDRSRSDVTSAELRDGTRRTLQALTGAGLRVVMMRDTPDFPVAIPACLARLLRHTWAPRGVCDFDKSETLNPAIFAAETTAARGLPNVRFLDLTDRLCPGSVCPAEQNGVIMYRDKSHLTGRFSDSLREVLEERLAPIVNTPR